MNVSTELQWIDYLVILIYFSFVLGIGFILRCLMRTSSDFLASGWSIPARVAGELIAKKHSPLPRSM
jgi:solute:Na+ symporter, SSS family